MIKPEKVIRSKRKTLSLQINENGELIVRVPKFVSDSAIQQFIEKHRNWIEKKVREINLKKSRLRKHSFVEGEEYLFIGNSYSLKFVDGNFLISAHEGSFPLFSGEFFLLKKSQIDNAAKLIEKLYKKEARSILEDRVKFYVERFNQIYGYDYSFRKIKLTNGRRNIGSCSPKGDLNFSWRIIQAPIEIIDYIVVHEIVHLKEKHHRKTFWSKVKKLYPNFKNSVEWVKENWFYLRDFLRNEKN
jgi:predicted metal-dependent hydrolase